MPAPIIDAIRLSLSNSITYMFLIGAAFVAVAFFTSVLIRTERLKTVQEYHEELDTDKA
ncbi:MAG: hypothetical protein LUO79_01220 [Methanomassiliicoccales archaeon]|nr:hypothetical protein [Methanomassiliicoccales archaeon]